MKKIYLSLILMFLAHFFTVNLAYCEEDFFTRSNYEAAKSQTRASQSGVSKGFSKLKDKFNFLNKKNNEKGGNQEENKGYYGTLPDIEGDFEYKKQKMPQKPQVDMKIPTEDELDEQNLKKAPFDDALFLDMVIKKEADSQYVNDIQKIKFALNNLKKCLENSLENTSNIQYYNGCVNVLELYVQNLKKKYENKSEALKESYIELLNTNYYAKVLGNLKYDANYYSRYVPVNEGQYSKQNIQLEEQKLLDRVNRTLFLLNNES